VNNKILQYALFKSIYDDKDNLLECFYPFFILVLDPAMLTLLRLYRETLRNQMASKYQFMFYSDLPDLVVIKNMSNLMAQGQSGLSYLLIRVKNIETPLAIFAKLREELLRLSMVLLAI